MRVAAFSDTHGNVIALEAVLADIRRQGPFDHVLMAGDLVAGGPRPAETLHLISALHCSIVLGNTDYYLFAESAAIEAAQLKPSEQRMNAWAATRIGAHGLAMLRSLPRAYHLPGPEGGIRMVHANPDDLEAPIAPDEDEATLRQRLQSVREPVLLFGHLHIAYTRQVGSLLLVDTASAGFPRDGDWRAVWSEIWHDGTRWQARLHRVEYDRAAVIEDLLASDMPRAEKRARILRKAAY